MKRIQLITQLATLLAAIALLASPSSAHTVDLVAEAFTINHDWDGNGVSETITMWGFGLSPGTATVPGPRITVPPGDTTLTINLTNSLPVPVSIVIPGQTATLTPVRDGSGRVTSLTQPSGTFTWNNLKPGTYIYHSGTNLAQQVHMGLYGAVTADAAVNEAYPGVVYASEVVLFYSEIDPDLHAAAAATPLTGGFAHPNDYNPRYFLVNGQPYQSGAANIIAGGENQPTLVRMLSTALGDLVPTILGMPWQLVAEDGNPYPFPRNQHTTLLSASKTKDAIITPTNQGTFAVFDRRGHLTNDGAMPGGMLAKLQVGATAGAPVANPDSATVAEGGTVTMLDSTATSVLANDAPNTGATVILVDNVVNGALTLNPDGTFSYTHNGSETTDDAFTYRTNDGAQNSNVTTVAIVINPANDAPVAVNDAYEVVEGDTLSVAAPGVLGNDTDAENNALTAAVSGTIPSGLSLSSDGSFTYTPTGTIGAVVTFQYIATDDGVPAAVSEPATVTITVTPPPANLTPLAENDFASTTRNVPVTINVVANDSDPDGTIDPASVDVTSGSLSARGGTVANQNNGTVIYTPKRNFRGTDTFTYRVSDTFDPPGTSNEATVQVNVTR